MFGWEQSQDKLNLGLIDAAKQGQTQRARELLAAGADVHAEEDYALRWAAEGGHAETVRELLAAGADVHAWNDWALRWAAEGGHAATVRVLARHIFASAAWDGKGEAEIQEAAGALYRKMADDTNIRQDRREAAAKILVECAVDCWDRVRPPRPTVKIGPAAKPKPA